MTKFESPEKHMRVFVERAAVEYADGLARLGLEENETLTRAVAERVAAAALKDYERQIDRALEENTKAIMQAHKARMRELDLEGVKLAFWMCPMACSMFGAVALFNLSQGHPLGAIIPFIGVLAFLALLAHAVYTKLRR
jgi:hypothetical protein